MNKTEKSLPVSDWVTAAFRVGQTMDSALSPSKTSPNQIQSCLPSWLEVILHDFLWPPSKPEMFQLLCHLELTRAICLPPMVRVVFPFIGPPIASCRLLGLPHQSIDRSFGCLLSCKPLVLGKAFHGRESLAEAAQLTVLPASWAGW